MQIIRAVDWSPDGTAVRIIDQRRLPATVVERDLASLDDVCEAIRTLAVRGAPAIGVAGAMGLVVSLERYGTASSDDKQRKRGAQTRAHISLFSCALVSESILADLLRPHDAPRR